jgi:hypothetical protein
MSDKSLNLYEMAQLYLKMEAEEVDSLSIEQKEGLMALHEAIAPLNPVTGRHEWSRISAIEAAELAIEYERRYLN